MALQVCRICGGDTKLENISDRGPETIEKILQCANVQVCREDTLHCFICQHCDQRLDYKLRKSEETASLLKKELNIKNEPADVKEFKVETATISTFCKEEIKQYTSVKMPIKTSVESASNGDCNKEETIHLPLKIEPVDIDEEEFQMIDNSNPVLKNESNDAYDNYGSLEVRLPSIAIDQNDIKIEEVELMPPDQIKIEEVQIMPPDQISMYDNDGYDAAESQNYLQMQQNVSNNMFIEGDNKDFFNCNHDTNTGTSPSESLFVDDDSIDTSATDSDKIYTCNICMQKFMQLDDLKRHMELHSDEYGYTCTTCYQSFRSNVYLDTHVTNHHPRSQIHQQDNTTQRWTPGINIPEKNQCDYCGKQLKTFLTYQRHMESLHPNVKPPCKCKTCDSSYYTLKSLIRHEKLQHSGNDRPFKCDVCFKCFKLRTQLTRHTLVHSDLPPQYSCSICSAKFRRQDTLDTHMLFHSMKKTFKLKDIKNPSLERSGSGNSNALEKDESALINRGNRLEDSPTSSNEHILNKEVVKPAEDNQKSEVVELTGADHKIHSSSSNKKISWDSQKNTPKRNQCGYCSIQLKTSKSYKEHLLMHTKNKLQSKPGVNIPEKNQCDYCGKQLKSPQAYQAHMYNIHPNVEAPYKCKPCNLRYFNLNSLTRHERLQHSDKIITLKCDICLKSFKRLSDLKTHNVVHSELPPQHSCSICLKAFRYKQNLVAHMRIHSEGEPYKCGICSEAFVHPNSLRRHTNKLHSNNTNSGNINLLEKTELELIKKDIF